MLEQVDSQEQVRKARAAQAGEGAANCCGLAARPDWRAVLKDLIHRLRRSADDLESLSAMLPETPTPAQDQALWRLAISLERR